MHKHLQISHKITMRRFIYIFSPLKEMSPAKTTLKGVKKTVCALISEQQVHPTKSQKSFTYVSTLFTVEFCHQPFRYDLAGP